MEASEKKLTVKDLLHYIKEELRWSKIYWDRTHQLGVNEYTEQDINEAFNKWNWATADVMKAIETYEKQLAEEAKEKDKFFLYMPEYKSKTPTQIMQERKEFTRFEHENSYGVKTTIAMNTEDPDLEECVQAFYTLMVSATYPERHILETMKQFAEDKLQVFDKKNED